MIISRTPFRVSFFGGGTDFPDFFREHGGAVLSTAIDKYCYISIHRLSPFFKYRFRASYARTELVQDPSEFQHPLIRESLQLLDIRDGLEITHVSDLPGRTGLGTSSAFTVGLLNTLHTFRGDRITAVDLAREAIAVERERVGDAGGHQDQYAAAFGGFSRIDFHRDGSASVRPLPVGGARLADLQSRLLLFYLGVEQSSETILRDQQRRTTVNVPALQDMLRFVDEGERLMTGGGPLDDFGLLLHEAWTRKRRLADGISNTDIDRAYDAARAAGATGGKLLGAGGRGFLLLYADPAAHDAIATALPACRRVRFGFSEGGSRIIFQASET